MIVLPQMRAVLSHHSAGVTELVPTIKYASLASSATKNNTTYSSLLTFTITTASTTDCINIVLSACGSISGSGGTPAFQITVDGTDIGQTATTAGHSGQTWNCTRVASVTGLSVGSHTVVVNWKNSNTATLTIDPTNGVHHCWAVARLATGTSYATLATNKTSTATTPTDALISTTYTSTQSSSALYIRFSATGASNSAGEAMFQIKVDGTAVCGTAGSTDSGGFGFNAGAVVIVPVTAGSHAVSVIWSGGGNSGSTITVSTLLQHAALLVDEVNTGSPHSGKCTSDIAAGSDAISASITTPAGGSSAILIEGTMSAAVNASSVAQGKLVLDGTTVEQSKRGADVGGALIDTMPMLYVTTGLSAGSHTAVLNLVAGTLNASLHPEYAHANVVVWPVTVQT